MTSGLLRLLSTVPILFAAATTIAGTIETPGARAEIEKYNGPYPGAEFLTLRTVYKAYLREAGFETSIAIRDLSYGPHERHKLDVLKPRFSSPRPMPVLVFVHGGAFVRGNKSDGEIFDNVLNFFTRHGVLGINATYRLAPEHPFPAGAEDLRDVVAWVRAHAIEHGGDPDKIFLMGHSAGAVHVASYTFMEELQADDGDDGLLGSILLSGVYGPDGAGASGNAYYGDEPKEIAKRVPLAHIAGRSVPLFVIDAEYDPLRMQKSAIELIQAVCNRDGKCPQHEQIAGHNHYSMTYHINTLDDSIASDILEFIVELSRDE